MSKLNIRLLLAVLISLGVIFALYTTVLGAPLGIVGERMGSHLVGGMMTNFNHGRLSATEQQLYQSQLDAYYNSAQGSGHDCGSQSFNSPQD